MGIKEHIIFPEIDYDKTDKGEGLEHYDRDNGTERRRRSCLVVRTRDAFQAFWWS